MGNVVAIFAPQSAISQQFPPKSKFVPARDIPDLTGKVTIVTGGNSGIGYQTVKQLLLKNAKVYLAARSATRCEDAVKRLKEETGGKEPVILHLDLADLHSVKKAAEEFLSKEERLDILFNNAAVMAPPPDLLTVQGYDLQFGTNVLGHYFFTMLLLPALERSTTYHETKSRVVNTSSAVHDFAPGRTGLDWKTMKGAGREEAIKRLGYVPQWKLYGASKIGSIFLSNILTRYHGDVVTSCAVHPGSIITDLVKYLPGWQQWITHKICHPAPFGAFTQLWAGTTREAEGVSGKYLIPWARVGKADPRAANEATQDELKGWLDLQLKEY
ncbi:NAD-P-binding protein [Gautieria morchelliformis]|nr:NAD-P-binding protein [Gautieria morchelliformis]